MSEWIRVNLVEPAKERRREEGRKEGRVEGRVEGREEGRAEVIAEFKDWDTRRRKAKERDEPFNEPPPYTRNGASNGNH